MLYGLRFARSSLSRLSGELSARGRARKALASFGRLAPLPGRRLLAICVPLSYLVYARAALWRPRGANHPSCQPAFKPTGLFASWGLARES